TQSKIVPILVDSLLRTSPVMELSYGSLHLSVPELITKLRMDSARYARKYYNLRRALPVIREEIQRLKAELAAIKGVPVERPEGRALMLGEDLL
ncbi:MAG TPA: hypothetical protein VEI97_05255, partial [bacterium]|nr:hypothetical protein [bacterium]